MKTKVLNIVILAHEGKLLIKETWHIFGGEVMNGIPPESATVD